MTVHSACLLDQTQVSPLHLALVHPFKTARNTDNLSASRGCSTDVSHQSAHAGLCVSSILAAGAGLPPDLRTSRLGPLHLDGQFLAGRRLLLHPKAMPVGGLRQQIEIHTCGMDAVLIDQHQEPGRESHPSVEATHRIAVAMVLVPPV